MPINPPDTIPDIPLPSHQGLHKLEQQYDAVSDPTLLFVTPTPSSAPRAAHLPDWLKSASDTQRLAYRTHLLELAAAKAHAQGQSFLDGISDLRTFAARALHAQMLTDQPIAPGYNPDELELTFAVAAGYAHFHYADTTVADSAYSVAHLKLAHQRFLLQKDLVRGAGPNDSAVLKVIYADVTPPLDQKLFLGLLG